MNERVITPPCYGEYWQGQGGVVVDFVPSMGDKPGWYLIATVGGEAEKAGVAWGPEDLDVPGAQDDWDGLANTIAMANNGRQHPAAEWVRGLAIDGHSDFYIPSQQEQRLLWARVPKLFQSRYYWSSTQSSRHDAWLQSFGDGGQGRNDKRHEARIRAVRRFTVGA